MSVPCRTAQLSAMSGLYIRGLAPEIKVPPRPGPDYNADDRLLVFIGDGAEKRKRNGGSRFVHYPALRKLISAGCTMERRGTG